MSLTLSHCEVMRLVVSARGQKSEEAEGLDVGHISGGLDPPDEALTFLHDQRAPSSLGREHRRVRRHETRCRWLWLSLCWRWARISA